MNRTLVLFAVLGSTLAAAELPTLSVSAGYTSQLFTARGYDLVGEDDTLHQGRVAVGAGFGLPFGALDFEVGYAAGGTGGVTHGVVPVTFALKSLLLGVAYRVPVRGWFQPYAQISGAADWTTLTLMGESRLTQTVASFSGTGLLGVQFAVRLGPSTTPRLPWLIFDLGAGAVLRPATRFDAMGPAKVSPDPVDPIAVGTVNLGSVPLSGFTARVLIGVRY